MNNRKKIIIITSVIVLLLIAVIYVVNVKPVKTGFNIVVVPSDSKVLMDGKPVGSGNVVAKPGKHSIEVSHKDFSTTKTEGLSIDNQIVTIPIGLNPNTDAGIKWKSDHNSEYLALDGLVSEQFNNESGVMAKTYPIVADLPKDISPIFRIDYGVSKRYPNDPTKIALYVSSDNPADKVAALKYIYVMGYDPSDYEIIFEGL